MTKTNEMLDGFTPPPADATREISDTVTIELADHSIEERTYFMFLYAVKHYNQISNPEYSTTDYLLAAEEVANQPL